MPAATPTDSASTARRPSSRLRRLLPAEVSRGDLGVVAAVCCLVLAAVVAGRVARASDIALHAPEPPFFAPWDPRTGPGTWWAVGLAVLVVALGPVAARRLGFSAATLLATLVAGSWMVALAFVDGEAGLTEPLLAKTEYLLDVPRAPAGLTDLLSGFVAGIPGDADEAWRTHVAGHPPGLFMVFVGLDRIGLGGAPAAAALCVVAATSIVAAVAVAVRAVAGPDAARRVLPFSVLLPAVIWAAVSADAVVAAVGAWGVALLAVAVTSGFGTTRAVVCALAAGLVLGLTCFLSYGGVLLGVPALALIAVHRRWRLFAPVAGAALVVLAAFAAGGFWWFEGLTVLQERYVFGLGGDRPYAYWSWANLAVLVVAAGPAVWPALPRLWRLARYRRTVMRPDPEGVAGAAGLMALAGGALVACLIATLSGMSKAETERIWLPWIVWLPVACAALPRAGVRFWLATQATTALAVQHLLFPPW